VEWQQEIGYSSWNLYRGDLAELQLSGTYTQASGSNALASQECTLSDPWAVDTDPQVGDCAFYLVTGEASGLESTLGEDSAGITRANSYPCP